MGMTNAHKAKLARRKAEILRRISADERIPWRLQQDARHAADAAEILADWYEAEMS